MEGEFGEFNDRTSGDNMLESAQRIANVQSGSVAPNPNVHWPGAVVDCCAGKLRTLLLQFGAARSCRGHSHKQISTSRVSTSSLLESST